MPIHWRPVRCWPRLSTSFEYRVFVEFDVTTGARFHPIGILFSMCIKLGVVAVLGPPAVAVVSSSLLVVSL